MIKKYFLILVIFMFITLIGCTPSKKEFICPDLTKLNYKEETDTYIQWINCMPHEGVNRPCGVDSQYEQWVNESCEIKFKIMVAE